MRSLTAACCLTIGILIPLCTPAAAAGQATRATLAGDIRDQGGLVLPGVTVTVVRPATGTTRSTVTNESGVYAIAGLTPGSWRVTFQLPGFRTVTHDGVRLESGETRRVDETLRLAGIDTSIAVQADLPVLRTESATLGAVIDQTGRRHCR